MNHELPTAADVERVDRYQRAAHATAAAALDESVDLRLRSWYAGVALHYDALAGRERRKLDRAVVRARVRARMAQAESGIPG